jgi:hypothetical protein
MGSPLMLDSEADRALAELPREAIRADRVRRAA